MRLKSISDDDICADCVHCIYNPGEMSGCALDWPAVFNADGYAVSCPQLKKRESLSDYLAARSAEICRDNHCTEDNHNCESYAYINADCQLMDVCIPDYFQGSSKPHAAIPLPWTGTQSELEAEVADQCAEME